MSKISSRKKVRSLPSNNETTWWRRLNRKAKPCSSRPGTKSSLRDYSKRRRLKWHHRQDSSKDNSLKGNPKEASNNSKALLRNNSSKPLGSLNKDSHSNRSSKNNQHKSKRKGWSRAPLHKQARAIWSISFHKRRD